MMSPISSVFILFLLIQSSFCDCNCRNSNEQICEQIASSPKLTSFQDQSLLSNLLLRLLSILEPQTAANLSKHEDCGCANISPNLNTIRKPKLVLPQTIPCEEQRANKIPKLPQIKIPTIAKSRNCVLPREEIVTPACENSKVTQQDSPKHKRPYILTSQKTTHYQEPACGCDKSQNGPKIQQPKPVCSCGKHHEEIKQSYPYEDVYSQYKSALTKTELPISHQKEVDCSCGKIAKVVQKQPINHEIDPRSFDCSRYSQDDDPYFKYYEVPLEPQPHLEQPTCNKYYEETSKSKTKSIPSPPYLFIEPQSHETHQQKYNNHQTHCGCHRS